MSRKKRRAPVRKPIPASKIGKRLPPVRQSQDSADPVSVPPYKRSPWYRYDEGWKVASDEVFRVSLGGWPGTPGASQTSTTLQEVCDYANRTRYADLPALTTETLVDDIIQIDAMDYTPITYSDSRPANIELGPDVDVDHLLATAGLDGFLEACMERLLDACIEVRYLMLAIAAATRHVSVDDPDYRPLLNEIFAEMVDELDRPSRTGSGPPQATAREVVGYVAVDPCWVLDNITAGSSVISTGSDTVVVVPATSSVCSS